ncbi:MAG: hypothetical protein GY754_17680 [bacterium]|nr:hypothetical protein [bacterium]
MSNTRFRTFLYTCKCGHIVQVFCDYGLPQENYKCRRCGAGIKRKEI